MVLSTHNIRHFLSELGPQRNTARLALFNFLQYICPFEKEMSQDLFYKFCYHALSYLYWRQNRISFAKEMKFIFDHLQGNHGISQLPFSPQSIIEPLQIIEVRDFNEVGKIVENYLQDKLLSDQQCHIFPDVALERVVAVILNEDNSLSLFSFNNKMTLLEGKIQPLCPYFQLQYNENLELTFDTSHYLQVNVNSMGVLQRKADGLYDLRLLRGYTFDCYHHQKQNTLQQPIEVFYALKRLEQFFISKETDGFYKETLKSIEDARDRMQSGKDHVGRKAKVVLQRAQDIYRYVFSPDQTLDFAIQGLRSEILRQQGLQNTKEIMQ